MTGWTAAELRAQPARLVRALAWREFAKRAWDPELAAAARRPINRDDYSGPKQWVAAVKARDEAAAFVKAIETELWPEDADG